MSAVGPNYTHGHDYMEESASYTLCRSEVWTSNQTQLLNVSNVLQAQILVGDVML